MSDDKKVSRFDLEAMTSRAIESSKQFAVRTERPLKEVADEIGRRAVDNLNKARAQKKVEAKVKKNEDLQ